MRKFIGYIKEARTELSQVQWPTRKEAVWLTWIVIAFSIILALILGGADFLFSYLLRIFAL